MRYLSVDAYIRRRAAKFENLINNLLGLSYNISLKFPDVWSKMKKNKNKSSKLKGVVTCSVVTYGILVPVI